MSERQDQEINVKFSRQEVLIIGEMCTNTIKALRRMLDEGMAPNRTSTKVFLNEVSKIGKKVVTALSDAGTQEAINAEQSDEDAGTDAA